MSKKAKSQAVTRNTNATYNMEGTQAVSPELNSIRPISRLFKKKQCSTCQKTSENTPICSNIHYRCGTW